jgi:error-prone DNA polymerase
VHLEPGALIQIAGLVVCRQRPCPAKGLTFLLLEDEHGLTNVVVYPRLYEAQRDLVRGKPFVIIAGRIQREEMNVNLIATCFEPLETVFAPPDLDAIEENGKPRKRLAPTAHNYR